MPLYFYKGRFVDVNKNNPLAKKAKAHMEKSEKEFPSMMRKKAKQADKFLTNAFIKIVKDKK